MNVLAGEAGAAVLTGPVRTGGDADERITLLHTLHAKALYKYLLRLTLGDRRQAEDVLQETLLRTWRYLRGRPLAVETLRPWLYTVAKRVHIDAVRARLARPAEVGAIDVERLSTQDDDVERMVTVQAVRHALMSLSPEHREILVEVYYRERSVKEAAEVLGIPVGTVKSRTYYALRALRQAAVAAGLEN
jgi:RNA polymerase sigma-70 factor (ECF subfamily)